MKKKIIGLLVCIQLMGIIFTASATSIYDPKGDVWNWSQIEGKWSWTGNVRNKPNIDIKRVSYAVNQNTITLSLKVFGSIQTSGKVAYYVFYNSTDTQYFLSYMNGSGGGFGIKGLNFTSEQNVTICGDTLSVDIDVLGDTSKVDLWGYAFEYTTIGDVTSKWWGDWAPNSKIPFSKKAFIIGRYTNLTKEGGNITIEATNLRLIFWDQFQMLHYAEGENITFIKDTAKVIILPRFIIGIVDVLT